ncbi:cytochrome P450 [Halobacterium rubrum]|uniref:cytochrome P450 n=1 Tax=Halobacterium TaxID=2239 RepID=UPI001F2DC3D2|nr:MULTISPECIES: cytochrome P450 [Halobacterium]MDH5019685.1 cytochrome P450 [Halobacterium rubrum]
MSEATTDAPLAPKRDGVPVLGSAVAFGRDPYAFYEDVASHGDVVRFSMGTYDMAGVLHPNGIRRVLVEEPAAFRKPDGPGVDVLADGLLLTDGDRWQRQRGQLQPLFYRERIETYAETMATYAAAAADEWAADAGGVQATEATSRYTLRVLGKTLLGAETDEHRAAVRAGANAIRERTSENPVAVDLPEWLPTPSNCRYRRGVDRLNGVVDTLLADADGTGEDLLSVLVAQDSGGAGGRTEDELRSQLVTFLFAGHETSATALTWALYELGRKPEVAARLQSEVDAVLDGGHATLGDLPALSYTEQVIREVLRRYPPASAIFRETREPVVVGGYRIPADTFVVLPQFHVHTDPRWWDEPMTFDPERWTDVDDPPGDRPDYAYFPFGGGPRHCIGMRFARMELQLALATIARRTTVSHDCDDVGVDVGSTTQPATDPELRFEAR